MWVKYNGSNWIMNNFKIFSDIKGTLKTQILFVCLFVYPQNPLQSSYFIFYLHLSFSSFNCHLSTFILHLSSFDIHLSTFILHFLTFKLFRLIFLCLISNTPTDDRKYQLHWESIKVLLHFSDNFCINYNTYLKLLSKCILTGL